MQARFIRRAAPTIATALALVAASLLFVLGDSEGADHVPSAHSGHDHSAVASTAASSKKARALHDRMRVLWEDHIVWTRMAIVSLAAGGPDFPDTAARLMRNQTDIGNAIKPYYGRKAGNALTALLEEHITGAVDLLTAAKAGDTTAVGTAKSAWYDNGDRIARFLSKANPREWPAATMRQMMRKHLDDTLDEAVARLEGRSAADIRAYDRIHRHILMMADALSAGIVKQFPRRF